MVTEPIFAELVYAGVAIAVGVFVFSLIKNSYMFHKERMRRTARLAELHKKEWAEPEVHYGSNGQLYQVFPDPISGKEIRCMESFIHEREEKSHDASAWSNCPRCEMHALHWYQDSPLTEEEWSLAEVTRELRNLGKMSYADNTAMVQKYSKDTGLPIGDPIQVPARLATYPIQRECVNCKYVWGQNA